MTAVNPWLALPNGSPSHTLTRNLRAAHQALITTAGDRSGRRGEVRPIVWDSWRRSLGSGVDPDGGGPSVDLVDDSLRAYRDAHPLAAVMPVIRKLLVQDAESDKMIVAVTDAVGCLLWVEGDSRLRSQAARIQFVEGANWGESHAGTNAPAIALALDHCVQVYGSEHFHRRVQPWSCSAAPVHDPMTGQLLGALDVTGGDHVASPHMLTLVRAAAAAAEAELRWQRLQAVRATANRPTLPDPPPRTATIEVLGRDRGHLSLPGRQLDLSLRHSELLLLLCEAAATGEGRTAEQLMQETQPAAAGVTVRAEMSRLRRAVGEEVFASRPYRLVRPVDSDLARVRRLLDRGAHRQALEAYRGPLLPASTAPHVVELRQQLAGQIARLAGHRIHGEVATG
ncbi:MAG: GAF domain-containing protein [Geodermatophilaceae bacterium]